MAEKVIVTLVDDLDGGRADETLRFGLDGRDYEIDLSKKNAKALREGFRRYIEHARKARAAQRPRARRTAASRRRSADIRAWAKGQGVPVSPRGRIPSNVVEQYEAVSQGR